MKDTAESLAALPSLAARAQLGSRAALEKLLRILQHPLGVHIAGIIGDSDTARDVLQDSLLLISRHLKKLTDPRWVRAWSYRIATREAIRARKKRGMREDISLDSIAELPDSGEQEQMFEKELIEELPSRLDALPALARTAVRMHYLDELSQAEIAAALEVPLGTVKSRIAYGVNLLRREWAERARTDALTR